MAQDFKTQALHHAYKATDNASSIAVPLYATTAYNFESAEHGADLFALRTPGFIYTRLNNPTVDVLEHRIAALEGGIGAVATSCGTAAISTALLTLLCAGDHIVASKSLYGGTFNLLAVTLPRLGIKTSFVDVNDLDAVESAIRPETKLVYSETIGNPKLDFVNIKQLSELAHKHGLPLFVDNTVTPYLCRPLECGADVVILSLTKYIAGNGTVLGGAIVDSGRYNWGSGKHPEFVEPSLGYHGLVYAEALGVAAYLAKLRIEGLRDLGACISPYNAHQIILSLETLALRIERHSANALAIAEWLEKHPKVAWVNYPGLKNSPYHEVASQHLKGGFSGLVTFGPKGGYEEALKVANSLHIFTVAANLGDAKSLVIHPSSTTHQQLSAEDQLASGVTPDLIRLSIGLEDVEDLKADLDQALAQI